MRSSCWQLSFHYTLSRLNTPGVLGYIRVDPHTVMSQNNWFWNWLVIAHHLGPLEIEDNSMEVDWKLSRLSASIPLSLPEHIESCLSNQIADLRCASLAELFFQGLFSSSPVWPCTQALPPPAFILSYICAWFLSEQWVIWSTSITFWREITRKQNNYVIWVNKNLLCVKERDFWVQATAESSSVLMVLLHMHQTFSFQLAIFPHHVNHFICENSKTWIFSPPPNQDWIIMWNLQTLFIFGLFLKTK